MGRPAEAAISEIRRIFLQQGIVAEQAFQISFFAGKLQSQCSTHTHTHINVYMCVCVLCVCVCVYISVHLKVCICYAKKASVEYDANVSER